MKSFDLDKINSLLSELKSVRIKEAVHLRKRLQKEKERLSKTQIKVSKKAKQVTETNQRRSSFMKNVWRYVKLVYDTYPDLREKYTIKQVFAQFFARRRGQDIDIEDVKWQNASG